MAEQKKGCPNKSCISNEKKKKYYRDSDYANGVDDALED